MEEGNEANSDQEKAQTQAVDRRKRVQRLKKIIIYGLIIGIVVPWILCAVLLVLVLQMHKEQDSLNDKMYHLTNLLEAQQKKTEEWQKALEERLNDEQTKREDFEQTAMPEEKQATELDLESKEADRQDSSSELLHKVYLTFDDGPSVHTNEILDILQAYGVKATFFVLGKEGEGSKQALKRIVEEGHTLGMHSYSHQYDDIYSSKEAFAEDFKKIQDYIFQVTGVTSKLYRFPGGSSNTVTNTDIHEFIAYLEEQNTVYFDWNISSGDAAKVSLSAETIAENATRGIENRTVSVILFHDAAGRETTVEALPMILERIQAMDHTVILPIDENTELIQHVKADN